MKISVIQASPHGMSGYTGRLLKPLLTAVEDAGAQMELFSFDSLKVYPCKGCLEIAAGLDGIRRPLGPLNMWRRIRGR